MNVLPDDAGDRHRAHEAHDHDALALHQTENAEQTSNTERRMLNGESEFDVRRWMFGVRRFLLPSR
jgi:hypothetical protein